MIRLQCASFGAPFNRNFTKHLQKRQQQPFPSLLPGNMHYEVGGKTRRTEKLCFDPGCERNSSLT